MNRSCIFAQRPSCFFLRPVFSSSSYDQTECRECCEQIFTKLSELGLVAGLKAVAKEELKLLSAPVMLSSKDTFEDPLILKSMVDTLGSQIMSNTSEGLPQETASGMLPHDDHMCNVLLFVAPMPSLMRSSLLVRFSLRSHIVFMHYLCVCYG